MKREELKAYRPYANRDGFYHKSDADSVMDAMEARIKELEAENKRLKEENLKHREDKMTLTLKYNEVLNILNNENEELKKQVPLWHFVVDGDLPSNNRDVIAFTGRTIYIDNYYGFYHDEHHWRIHDDVTHWCELPTEPPTTEKAKEN